jgi:hypothetical protein
VTDEVVTPVESDDVQPDASAGESPKPEDKPKRGRKAKHESAAVESAPVSPARAGEPADELPKSKFRCRIPKCFTRALEEWAEVEAVTPADAKEVYLAKMGIVSLSEGRKVEVAPA